MTAYGGIEAGGSKWECAVGTGPDDLRATETVPTTTPEETLGRVVAFFEREGPVEAIGVGSFGPVDRKPTSPTWGHITTTPKPGWAQTDVGQEIRRRLSVPVAFDTDVNAAALGEQRWGAAQGLDTFCYITVGTGIGGGAMVGGKPSCTASSTPSSATCASHTTATRTRFRASAPTTATAGKASRRAARSRRAGDDPRRSSTTTRSGQLQAEYLALGLVCVISVLSPERIVIGGGVMKRPGLLPLVHRAVAGLMNGYLDNTAMSDGIAGYITLPALGSKAGMLGAIALAETA